MAVMVAKCPAHGTESTTHTVGTEIGKGMVWRYTFPCCDTVVVISTARRNSPAMPDTPIIPTQRDPHHY